MKYDIEIDGLPDGWEPVNYAVPQRGDYYIDSMDGIINGPAVTDWDVQRRIIVRRKVQKYDWSKTLSDVLVLRKFREGAWSLLGARGEQSGLALCWQPNIHGKCPVDPDRCVIRVRFADGSEAEGVPNSDAFEWSLLAGPSMIVAYQFIRLADNVEW